MNKFTFIVPVICLLISGCGPSKKEFDPEYVKVTEERAQKIVDEMNLEDSRKELVVRDLIAEQYQNLRRIQDKRDERIERIRNEEKLPEAEEEELTEVYKKAEDHIADLHEEYLKDLNEELTPEQVIAVKDGMTYGVVPITYANYLAMLPQLTEEQKEFIYSNLVEAREYAMDGGSSEEKHSWFNKYKGKITNYLSAEGYELKKAEKKWLESLKADKGGNTKRDE